MQLILAVKNNDLDRVRYLLEHGICTNEADENGWTALHHAAFSGNCDIVEALVLCDKTDVNICTRSYASALGLACAALPRNQDRAERVVNILLTRPDLVINAYGRYKPMLKPIHYAAQYGSQNLIRSLVLHGADVNLLDCSRENALHYAIQNETHGAEVASCLVEEGINVWQFHSFRGTSLYQAILAGKADVANIILSSVPESRRAEFVDLRPENSFSPTALMAAIMTKNFNLASHLIDVGANVNIKVKKWVAMHWALLLVDASVQAEMNFLSKLGRATNKELLVKLFPCLILSENMIWRNNWERLQHLLRNHLDSYLWFTTIYHPMHHFRRVSVFVNFLTYMSHRLPLADSTAIVETFLQNGCRVNQEIDDKAVSALGCSTFLPIEVCSILRRAGAKISSEEILALSRRYRMDRYLLRLLKIGSMRADEVITPASLRFLEKLLRKEDDIYFLRETAENLTRSITILYQILGNCLKKSLVDRLYNMLCEFVREFPKDHEKQVFDHILSANSNSPPTLFTLSALTVRLHIQGNLSESVDKLDGEIPATLVDFLKFQDIVQN